MIVVEALSSGQITYQQEADVSLVFDTTQPGRTESRHVEIKDAGCRHPCDAIE